MAPGSGLPDGHTDAPRVLAWPRSHLRVRDGAIERDETGWTEEAAFVAFCAREYPRLLGALSLYCGDRDVAEELVQEALVRAADRWTTIRDMHQPAAWLRRVALNLAHSYFRRLAAERRAMARQGARSPQEHHDPDVAATLAVRQAVARLPRRQREVVVLRFYLDRSVAETAAELGCSAAAVTSLAVRARERLRRELEGAGALAPWDA